MNGKGSGRLTKQLGAWSVLIGPALAVLPSGAPRSDLRAPGERIDFAEAVRFRAVLSIEPGQDPRHPSS